MASLAPITLTLSLLSVVSMPLQGQVGVTTSNKKLPSSEGKTSLPVPDGVTLIEEKSLEFDSTLGTPPDPGGEPSNGVRFYSFVIQPRERLSVRMKAEATNRIGMQFLKPAKVDRMVAQFARLERMPKTLRSSFQEITNTTSEPYTVVLMVFGRVNHWFKVEIQRGN